MYCLSRELYTSPNIARRHQNGPYLLLSILKGLFHGVTN